MTKIMASTVLPAVRETITLRTADGLNLVGELARPADRAPAATLVCLHPLPTAGGMMDSHVLRKASYRLPALAGLAVLRFNSRGTSSDHGTSDGQFGEGEAERHDVAAAVGYAVAAGPKQDGDGEPSARLGPPQTEEWPDGVWVVRRVPGAAAAKVYRCPGCDQEIPPATPHVVAWVRHSVDGRRHWHTPCWDARSRRTALPRRR